MAFSTFLDDGMGNTSAMRQCAPSEATVDCVDGEANRVETHVCVCDASFCNDYNSASQDSISVFFLMIAALSMMEIS